MKVFFTDGDTTVVTSKQWWRLPKSKSELKQIKVMLASQRQKKDDEKKKREKDRNATKRAQKRNALEGHKVLPRRGPVVGSKRQRTLARTNSKPSQRICF